MLRKLIVEAIGTFFLVLTIGLVVLEPGAGALAGLAIGSVLMVMVYAGGHISGAHYNPAVTFAVWARGMVGLTETFGYWTAQIVGGVLGALVVLLLKDGGAVVPMVLDPFAAIVAELLFTFALAWVILNVATARGTQGNSYFGLAIGFTVLAGVYAVGPISGAAFNPAVAVALPLLGLAGVADLWMYMFAQFAGAGIAAMAFNAAVRPGDKPTTATPEEQVGLEEVGKAS